MTTASLVQVPYSGAIPGGVHEGLEIQIQGTVPNSAHEGFSVNLCQVGHKEPTTVLHINPRFHQNGVALNHLDNGKWGKEERRDLPLHKGRDFDLSIKVKSEEFKIKFNGNTADFHHRMSKETAKFLELMARSPSPPFASLHSMATTTDPRLMPAMEGLSQLITQFTVNLQSDRSGGDVALHFDVRFNYGNSHNVVVYNHFHGGHFANEERHASPFPFAPDANFNIVIQVEHNCYKFDVNGQHFPEFNHRLPVQSASILFISGAVRLTQIRFE